MIKVKEQRKCFMEGSHDTGIAILVVAFKVS